MFALFSHYDMYLGHIIGILSTPPQHDDRAGSSQRMLSWVPTADQINSINPITQIHRPSSTKGVYTTSSRPLVDHTRFPHDYSRLLHDVNPTTFPISARSSRPLHDPYTISTRPTGSLLDRCQIFPRPDRHGRTRVVEKTELPFIPFKFRNNLMLDYVYFF